MAAFEYYLLATFVMGIVQLRHYAALFRYVLQWPSRWPKLYGVIRENLNRLLTWPTVLTVGVMASAWLAHTSLRRYAYPTASVTWAELNAHTLLLPVALIAGLAMVALDARALFRVVRFKPPRRSLLLDVTEIGLKAEILPVKWLVRWRMRAKMIRHMPLVHQWMWKRTAEVGVRLVFGCTLWATWVLGAT